MRALLAIALTTLGHVSITLAQAQERPAATEHQPASLPVPVTKGLLDHSRWSTWIQGTPQVLVVSSLDGETAKLIAEQTRIFNQLTGMQSGTAKATAVNPAETELNSIKESFPNRRQRSFYYYSSTSYYMDVPHRDRWDSYQRTVAHASITNLPGIIVQLERKLESDLRDLETQANTTGAVAYQARADAGWIRSTMQPIVDQFKGIAKNTSTATPVERAREEWQTFEKTDLRLLQRIIESRTTGQASVADDGTFEVAGDGVVVAVITVANRKLYFPVHAPGSLRFFNIERRIRSVENIAKAN